jgi:hypothetical protein
MDGQQQNQMNGMPLTSGTGLIDQAAAIGVKVVYRRADLGPRLAPARPLRVGQWPEGVRVLDGKLPAYGAAVTITPDGSVRLTRGRWQEPSLPGDITAGRRKFAWPSSS